ncbi:MAG: hypothetical protein ABEL76_03105, partial [Bradymonadaceae bacterium]
MGSILEAEVGDLGEAAKSYQYSQQLASGKRPAVWARQSLARRREEWSKLGDLYAEELEVTDDRGRSVELYNKLGELAREQLGDEETAVQCFGYAYELDSTDERARTALVELGELEPEELPEAQEEGGTESVEKAAEPAGGESGGAVESAEEVEADGEVDEAEEQDEVDEEPEVAGDEESAPVETEADELPDDVDEVAEAELLDEDVEEISAESDLEEESSPPETPSDAPPAPEADAGGPQLEEPDEDEVELESDELEQAEAEPPAAPDEGGADESTGAEAAVDEEPPLEAPASQADAEPEEAPADDESVEIEADEIAGDESEAIEGAEEEELEEEVEGEEEVQPVDVTGGDRPGWPERCSEFVDRAEEADDPEPTAARLSEAARLHWLHGGGEEVAAMDLWRTAIESGAAEEFYDAARIYFRGEGTWSEIVEALEEADVAPSVLASASLFDLGDSERAASYLEGTEDEQLEQAVEDLGEAEGNWRRFQRSLEKRHRDLEGVEKAEAVYGYLADLARGAGAVDKEVDALRRYDRQVDDGAGDRLMVAYRAAEKWPMYVDLVKEHAESLDDERVADKVDWLEEAVRVYRDEMDHDMMVVNTYRDILEIDPENVAAVDALIDLYEEMNRSSELIDALQRKAELVEDDDRRIELYLEVAELFLDKFRNQAEAIEAYETILEIDPRHPEALEFLEEMYEKRRDWESLVDVRRRRAETLEDEDERIDALKEVAELASDRLRRTDVAAELWREIHDRRPDDPEALDALEELFEKGREWDELAGILELKTDHAEGEELFEQYQKLAQLYADRLDEPQRAVEAWRQALSIEPDDRKSRNALEQLYVDQRDWEALEAFYADRDEFRELARKYETLAGTLEAAEASVEVLLRAARVWREELDELGRAERALEQVLETDETNERAARRLEPLYRENEDAEGLREVLGILLEHADEVDERRQYQLQIARLHEEQLAEPDEAFDWYARAVEERPETDPVLDDLERAAGASERWGDLEEVYRSLLEGADLADDRRRDLRTRLGGVLFEHLDRGGDALEQFETILDEEPEHLGALAAVEEIHRSAERWDELLDVYQRRLELTEEPADRADILRGMAELAEEQKGDLQEAVDRLQEALSLEPSDTDTLAELQRLYRQREQWEDLAETLDAEIEVLEGRAADRGETEELEDEVDPGSVFPDELADTAAFEGETPAVGARYDEGEIGRLAELYARLGEVCREKLGCDGRAIEAFERAARWRPNLSEVRTGLEAYLDDDQWSVTAAELLGPIYEIHGDWTELTVALQLRAEQAPPAEAAQLYERLGRVQLEEIGEPEAAFAAYAEAAKMAPERDELREQLLQIADATDNWSRVADVLDDVVSLVDDPQLRGDYLLELAELADGRLDDLGRAESYYREYLEEAPEDREVLGALENVLERTEQWEPLLDVLEQQLELAKDAEALRTLRFRAAGVCAELLDRPERAIDFVEAAREDAPEDPEVLDALGRLYEETDRWRDLVDNAERQLELADEADEPAIRKRLAEVHHAELGEPVRAVDLLEEVVGSRPEDAEAIEQLESLIEVEGAPSTRIAQILEPLYLADESWDEMIAVLEVQVREADAPGERVHLLHRVAGLQEDEIDDPGAAFETYARALEDDVEDETTVDELYRLAEELDRWEELVEVFEERAELETDPEAIRGLLRRAAEIEVEQRDAYERAAPLLEEVAELFPSDLETLERLETIYRQLEDWDSLVETLRGRADREPDVDDQKELLYQAGEVADEFLDRPEQAVDVYREVLGLDPEDRRAIDRLEQLYTRLERWTDLLEIYQRKLKLVEDDQSRQDLLHAVGPLYEEELDQPYEAIDAYRSILDIDSEDLEAVEHLAELYEETEQWHELLDVLEHQLDLVSLEEERHAVRLEIGELWENELGDALRAVEEYEAILE